MKYAKKNETRCKTDEKRPKKPEKTTHKNFGMKKG